MKPLSKADNEKFTQLYKRKRDIEDRISQLNRELRSDTVKTKNYHTKMKELTDIQRNITDQLRELRGR